MVSVKKILLSIFTWWNGQTTGTWLYTKRCGIYVGSDSQGNTYYTDSGVGTAQRRWVIYNGAIEASRIPPEWHIWIHRMIDTPPTISQPAVKTWEKPHHENLTGTVAGYVPETSLHQQAPKEYKTYQAWKPE